MKANRKFLKHDENAVSPVIAVILMVAITVVLAATVYVWVSGFSASGNQPAKTIALNSNGALSSTFKNYTVSAATPGMKWSDVTFSVDGVAFNQTLAASDGGTACPTNVHDTARFLVCSGATTKAGTATVSAGDTVKIMGVSSGQTLRVLDSQANSVIFTITVS